MRKAKIYNHNIYAGELIEHSNQEYEFNYDMDYNGPPISLTLPCSQQTYYFSSFPTFFEGLLPEGILLEALLKKAKLDRNDLFGQLLEVGSDCVGSITIKADS